jgi:hypothetical protein
LGLVLRNPIRFLSILAISGIACSGTSPATTPAATDFNRALCPGLKSRCLSGFQPGSRLETPGGSVGLTSFTICHVVSFLHCRWRFYRYYRFSE